MATPPPSSSTEPETSLEELYPYEDPGSIPEPGSINKLISDNTKFKTALIVIESCILFVTVGIIILNILGKRHDSISNIVVGSIILLVPAIIAYFFESQVDLPAEENGLNDQESINTLYDRRIIQKVVYSTFLLVVALGIFGNTIVSKEKGTSVVALIISIMIILSFSFLIPYFLDELVDFKILRKFGIPMVLLIYTMFFRVMYRYVSRQNKNFNMLMGFVFFVLFGVSVYSVIKTNVLIVLFISFLILFFMTTKKYYDNYGLHVKHHAIWVPIIFLVFTIGTGLLRLFVFNEITEISVDEDTITTFHLTNNINVSDNCKSVLYDKSIINWDEKRVTITFDILLNSLDESKTLITCGGDGDVTDWEIKFDKPNESINLSYNGIDQSLSIPLTSDIIKVTKTTISTVESSENIAYSHCFQKCDIVDGEYTGDGCTEGDGWCEDESRLIQSMTDNLVYVHCPIYPGCEEVEDPIVITPPPDKYTLSVTLIVNSNEGGSGTITFYHNDDKSNNEKLTEQSIYLESMVPPTKWSKNLNVLNYKTIENFQYCQYPLIDKNYPITTLILISIITTIGIVSIIHPKLRRGLFGSKVVSFDVPRAYHNLMQ
jgi:hypothetical protein